MYGPMLPPLQFADELLRGGCGSCGSCADRHGRSCDDNEDPKTLHWADIAFGDAETLPSALVSASPNVRPDAAPLQFADELLRGGRGSCGSCADRHGRSCDDNEDPKTLHWADIAFGDAETLPSALQRRFDSICNVGGYSRIVRRDDARTY